MLWRCNLSGSAEIRDRYRWNRLFVAIATVPVARVCAHGKAVREFRPRPSLTDSAGVFAIVGGRARRRTNEISRRVAEAVCACHDKYHLPSHESGPMTFSVARVGSNVCRGGVLFGLRLIKQAGARVRTNPDQCISVGIWRSECLLRENQSIIFG